MDYVEPSLSWSRLLSWSMRFRSQEGLSLDSVVYYWQRRGSLYYSVRYFSMMYKKRSVVTILSKTRKYRNMLFRREDMSNSYPSPPTHKVHYVVPWSRPSWSIKSVTRRVTWTYEKRILRDPFVSSPSTPCRIEEQPRKHCPGQTTRSPVVQDVVTVVATTAQTFTTLKVTPRVVRSNTGQSP